MSKANVEYAVKLRTELEARGQHEVAERVYRAYALAPDAEALADEEVDAVLLARGVDVIALRARLLAVYEWPVEKARTAVADLAQQEQAPARESVPAASTEAATAEVACEISRADEGA